MKNTKIRMIISLLLLTISGYSQFVSKFDEGIKTAYKNVEISYAKTTSIVFPYAVKSVDRGSDDVLVQKAKGVENVLLLKAGIKNFKQTNLTVVTSDGSLYGFILNYDEMCPILNLMAEKSQSSSGEIIFSLENENQKEIEQYALLALSKKKKTTGLRESRYRIKLEVSGIFIHQDILYFRLVLGNKSRIGYDIDQLRFFIRDQKKSARTASQEIEIIPLFLTSDLTKIADESEITVVFAVSKFSIPQKKYLALQMFEKEGGRHVHLDIKNKDLNNVEVLNTL